MAKKTSSAAVKASRKAAGVKSTSVYLPEPQRERWARIADARGQNKTEALISAFDALEAVESGKLTDEELAAEVLRRMKRGGG